MNSRIVAIVLFAAMLLVPLTGVGKYPLHLMVTGLLWAFIYTSWSIMGRLGLVSLGHGAFLGVGAYTVVLLWNLWGISPWIGTIAAVLVTLVLAFIIGYPCFRFRIVGHYFALVTLALSEVVRLVIVGLREQTGGSLGITPKSALNDGVTASLSAMQFSSKVVWFYIMLACWVGALLVWRAVDRSMRRMALEASAKTKMPLRRLVWT